MQLLLGHSDMTMTQRYARTYTSEQAVRAHGELSPVARLETPGNPEAETKVQHEEVTAPELLRPRASSSDTTRPQENNLAPKRRARAAAARVAMTPGAALVATYKGGEYRCAVVEQDDALRYVFPDGRTFKSPSAAGQAITGNQVNGYQFWSVVDVLTGIALSGL